MAMAAARCCDDGGLSTVVEATSSGDGKLISNAASPSMAMATARCCDDGGLSTVVEAMSSGDGKLISNDLPFLRPDLVTALTRVPWMAIVGLGT
uniref:Uncharacterized protein n=1 Tax=Oryza rufipogon TaxID=4529 RepID=A0A0E0NLA3_ORYRU